MYISVTAASSKFKLSPRRVQVLCEQGRIEGATMVSGVWLIPSNANKPTDARKKDPASPNKYSAFVKADCEKNEKISIAEACQILSISPATARNWIRLGKLNAEDNGKTLSKTYIESLSKDIKSGKISALKSRRNKKSISGKALYTDYIQDEQNQKTIENILSNCKSISELELRIILAYFAVQLFNQSTNSKDTSDKLMSEKKNFTNNNIFNELILDLIGDVDLKNFDTENINVVFNKKIRFVSNEDTLGYIYISLKDISNRKQTGTYYTPEKIVTRLIRELIQCTNLKDKNILDPCCGTGNFLIGLVNNDISVNNIYGQDVDKISILVTRINMFIQNQNISRELLLSHFKCKNTLKSTFDMKFSVVLGNPPWGYDFSNEETDYLLNHYYSAKAKGMESFDLFIEKGISVLEEHGYLAYILPESLLCVSSHIKARELITTYTSFKFISYIGNVFADVQCPSIMLGLIKDGLCSSLHCHITSEKEEFFINNNREIDSSLFSFNMSDEEYDCFCAINSVQNAKYLANNSKFALGIVTGNNKEYIKDIKSDGMETILKGSDIYRYSTKVTSNYIHFSPDNFQQVAPTELYRAKEKLLYRFISEVPVFTYDDQQTLSLNSCNILIPQIDGMDMKYVLAILNSSIAAYFISKKYNSIKLLRAHIESLPIPMISEREQCEIVKKVDHIMNSKENICGLYEELDNEIMDIYFLSEKQRNTIYSALSGRNLFLFK